MGRDTGHPLYLYLYYILYILYIYHTRVNRGLRVDLRVRISFRYFQHRVKVTWSYYILLYINTISPLTARE